MKSLGFTFLGPGALFDPGLIGSLDLSWVAKSYETV